MIRGLSWILLFLSMATICYCQDAQTATPASDTGDKISFSVTLDRNLDSKKVKEGDSVTGVTAGTIHGRSGFLIPSGSKVIGHVTKAEARSNGGSESALGLAFDKIEVSKQHEIPIKGVLQAVAPTLGSAGPYMGAEQPQLASKGGAGSSAAPTSSMKVSGAANGAAVLIPSSQGVLGIKDLQMDANGLLTSSGKEVKLEHGSQLMIRAEIEMPAH
jgi:hypothetical protein